jgi:hypothetical protein
MTSPLMMTDDGSDPAGIAAHFADVLDYVVGCPHHDPRGSISGDQGCPLVIRALAFLSTDERASRRLGLLLAAGTVPSRSGGVRRDDAVAAREPVE